ncbi:ParA family protein [Streptomyces sp. NPDC001941]|uniref:ParA family protein n=1 Tax=Streptomyces sp. NPDC001941 TaxID=3154659 RepID=UPI00332169EE
MSKAGRARRVAFLNHKGGVAKTDTVVRLAEGLAKAGKRVLVVDMDPQANASEVFGWVEQDHETRPTISQAIQADREGAARAVIQPTAWTEAFAERIRLAPAVLSLENRMAEAGAKASSVRRLWRALDGADDDFDYTLIDCPPSLFHLTQLGLAAADDAVIVTTAVHNAVRGSKNAAKLVREEGANLYNPELALRGVIVAKHRQRGDHAEQLARLRELYGDLVWSPIVPDLSDIEAADTHAVPLNYIVGKQATRIRGTFELLTETFLKEIPA